MFQFLINSPKYGKKTVLIDKEDWDKIKNIKWCLKKDKENFYVHGVIEGKRKNFKMILLHRLITNATPGQIIDHINRNTLDNRKCNLRIVTFQQNSYNTRIFKNNTSGYKGVYKSGKKWVAKIRYNNKLIHIGSFNTKESANNARINKEKELKIL